MPPVGRTCSECGSLLSGKAPSAKTCSEACRQKRSRRLKRANRQIQEIEDQGSAVAEVAAIVRRESPDVIKDVMRDQLAPVVREALTEDVLRAVQTMLGLTPAAVRALTEHLESEDEVLRQRAAALVMKYTVGHPALLKADDADASRQIVVNFSLPRPEPLDLDGAGDGSHATASGGAGAFVDADELRQCDTCLQDKPTSEFESGSFRCRDCFLEWKAKVLEQFA